MLVMSDVSGPGVASLGLPYLTGYPLPESGLYALALTWPAPEMPRPGCVWTHTVLIGFADLAALAFPSLVTQLFQRPASPIPIGDYAHELLVDVQEHLPVQPFSATSRFWFEHLANALYEHPSEQVWGRRIDGHDVDDAVLRLWDQQWPRLRRSFRFCTLTSRDRSQDGVSFDLQLSPASESNFRFSSTQNGIEATNLSVDPWLESLVNDAQFPQASTLRQFLRRLGADMLGGREAMQSFCSLHSALEVSSLDGISDAVSQVENTPLFSASDFVKSIIVRAALAYLKCLDGHVFDFVVENLHLLSPSEIHEHQDALAQLLWRVNPTRFIVFGRDDRAGIGEAVRAGAHSIPREDLIRLLPQVDHLVEPLLELLPIVAEEPLFWSNSQTSLVAAVNAGIDLSKPAVFSAIVQGVCDDHGIRSAIQAVGAFDVLRCIRRLVESKADLAQLRRWLSLACVNTDVVARFLSDVPPPPPPQLLVLLTEILSPDAVPNEIGVDPWYSSLKALFEVEGRLPLDLQIYGFRRALGRRSRSVGEILKLTFEPLHTAAENRGIPEDSWQLLQSGFPWAPLGQDWDHAIRLRRATAKKCLEIQLMPIALASFVNSESLFLKLLEEIWDLWGGSRYLRSVSDALNKSDAERGSLRSHLIKNFVIEHSKFW